LRRQFALTEGAGAATMAALEKSAMNVTLKPFDFAQAVARAGLGVDGMPLKQDEATRLQREVMLDNPTVSLEQTMVAMQKAQIGFAATLQVRNRLVQAYSDIMGMQV